MKTEFTTYRSHRAAFTLVEMLAVMAIILLAVGLGVSAFKGGSNSDGTRSASALASTLFDAARTEAILRRTPCRVIVDTAYNSSKPENCYRRMTVAYLKVDATGAALDPAQPASWAQADKWTVLPANVYFDPEYSAGHGTMSVNFGGTGATASGYVYYEITPNGQAANAVSSTLPQFVVSPGRISSSGSFSARDANSRYGFVLFKMGRTAFLQNLSDIQKPATT